MITAGAATDMGFTDSEKSQNVEFLNRVISAVHIGEKGKHFEFYPVAVGNVGNIKQLQAISVHPPHHLKKDKWNEMFLWIADSFSRIVDNWRHIPTIIPSWGDSQHDS